MTTESITEEATIVVQVKIAELIESKTNRADLGKENGALNELAANIKQHGVIVPLIVRELPQGHKEQPFIEVVAGHRRLAAAELAGLKEVPCLIRQLTDQEALMVQSAENLHRKDLTAVEEARAFFTLKQTLNVNGIDLAKLVDKSEGYVYRALKLLDLPAAALKALDKGVITAAHAHQLVRVGPKQIDAAVKFAITPGYKNEVPTVADLRRYIDGRASKDLDAAPFPKEVAYASKIACTECPYNTGNQGVLFTGAEKGHCTNAPCFNAKTTEFYRQMGEKGKDKFKGLKFIGTGQAPGWEGRPTIIKGWTAVDAKDKKIAQALKSIPEKFAFGIIRPGRYDSKKASYVLLTKEEAFLPKKAEARRTDPTEEYRWRFVRDYVYEAMQEAEEKLEEQRVAVQKQAEAIWKKDKAKIIEGYKAQDAKGKEVKS